MDKRANVLRSMKICRFCLSEDGPLTSIYDRHNKDVKQNVPLPLQLMACIAIEVFQNDGMPQLICKTCRSQTVQAYRFKSNCKKADDALKVYLVTGNLIKPLDVVAETSYKDDLPAESEKQKKSDAPPSPKRIKLEQQQQQNTEIITLNYTNDLNQESETTYEVTSGTAVEDDNHHDQHGDDYIIPVDEENDRQHPDDNNGEQQEENSSSQYVQVFTKENLVNPTLTVNQVTTDCFPCPDCERSFPLRQLLDLHRINHERERNFVCDECDKAFFTKYDLGKHALTHKDAKPFLCVVCDKNFARESLLHRHQKIHTNVPKYLCSQCDRTFLTRQDLDSHSEKKHRKNRPFTCEYCNKSFVFKQGLERHESTHNTVKPHKCNYCEASFSSAIKLTRHVTSHAGLRPYPCKLCGRTFLLSHHLTRHMRSHYAAQRSTPFLTTIGQHKCDICSMSFKRKDSLINHSAIHSMVNLKCVICNTEFDNVDSVKEHITTHLTDLPHPCDKCDYSFETKEQLEDHELKHAEMEYEEQIEQEVIEEARKAAEDSFHNETNPDDDYYSGDDNIAEFTITNDMNNPELVRRKSRRSLPVKNYSEFLKDELDSEEDDEDDNNDNEQNQQNLKVEDPKQFDDGDGTLDEDAIKPIVRSEGTKVYVRKSFSNNKSGQQQQQQEQNLRQQQLIKPIPTRLIDQTEFSSIDSLSNSSAVSRMPPKEIFNMKIGDKTVMVQKLLLTKEQMRAMAKEGKIEKKGNTLLLKKRAGISLNNLSLDSIMGNVKSSTPSKQSVTKTYQRKSISSGSIVPATSVSINEDSVINFDESVSTISIEDAISNM